MMIQMESICDRPGETSSNGQGHLSVFRHSFTLDFRTPAKSFQSNLPIFTGDRPFGHDIFCTGEYFKRSASLRSVNE